MGEGMAEEGLWLPREVCFRRCQNEVRQTVCSSSASSSDRSSLLTQYPRFDLYYMARQVSSQEVTALGGEVDEANASPQSASVDVAPLIDLFD